MGKLEFEIVHAETDHRCVSGKTFRSPTVLIRVNRSAAISRKVFVLGGLLIACHIADGFLTFAGVAQSGYAAEGNSLLRHLISTHGAIPAVFLAKSLGVVFTIWLMWLAHSRRWLRPVMTGAILCYLTMALIPWLLVFFNGF